jgi:PPK2 family polyphosphate:nucleotide phosphotransferase
MKRYWIRPGKKVRLKKIDPEDTGNYSDDESGKAKAEADTEKVLGNMIDLQELLFADGNRSLLIVLQAMDTGGKDGTIKNVMRGANPQGCRVASFKVPTPWELSHDFLWRVHKEVPPKGFIGIFNRSHYEDVLVPRVHRQIDRKTVERRFRQINDFERLLAKNGTVIRKFFLHISKDEQRKRLEARAKDPKKHWKFNINDLKERRLWDRYQEAFQDAIEATSTEDAPWIIVPANNKWYRNLVVGKIVVETLQGMKLKYPKPPPDIDFKRLKIV